MNAVIDERIEFASGALRLEGVLSYPQDEEPKSGVLLLPPHPHFAGDLDNNVVRGLAAHLAIGGFVVLRINYRGVGKSEIDLAEDETVFDYWERVEVEKRYESIVDDAEAALTYLRRTVGVGNERTSLVGYSFGAIVASLLACRRSALASLVAIAPPLRRYSLEFLRGNAVRKGFFFSSNDFLYDTDDIQRLRRSLGDDCSTTTVTADDHFFRGIEADLAAPIRDYLQEASE